MAREEEHVVFPEKMTCCFGEENLHFRGKQVVSSEKMTCLRLPDDLLPGVDGHHHLGCTGASAFESLTAGTFTVTAGLRSRRVTLSRCDSQANVDLCPLPTPTTL